MAYLFFGFRIDFFLRSVPAAGIKKSLGRKSLERQRFDIRFGGRYADICYHILCL
jgi:hypothetical protein